MKAVVFAGTRSVEVREVPDAVLQEPSEVFPGCTAAVFGAGTIGLLSAYSCLLRGADAVYVVDYIPERLEMAARLGAVPVDFRAGDPVEQIRAERGTAGLP